MTLSERVYRKMLIAYPGEHRRRYGEPMALLFRDRLRRDGGGFGTVLVWGHVGFDLARSAFTERMETAMTWKPGPAGGGKPPLSYWQLIASCSV